MTEDDAARVQIGQLLAAAAQASDTGDDEAYVGCFTEQGVMAFGNERMVGRAAIRAWRDTRPKGTQTAMHHLTTSRITIASERAAQSRTYWMVVDQGGMQVSGCYSDALEREDDGWRIADRLATVIWSRPPG